MSRHDDLNTFYALLDRLKGKFGGFRYLRDCTGKSGWPERGLYFFFEEGELRQDGVNPRVVRIGTHAVSEGSETSLWDRLHTHRGHADGGGNHRGSIFRKRIGEALLRDGDHPEDVKKAWGRGSTAPKSIRVAEHLLEIEVSRYIGRMPFLWLEVDDQPSRHSKRGYLERNAIALLSNFQKPVIDPASKGWLGLRSGEPTICESGLWNTNHVERSYDPRFLEEFATYVENIGGDRRVEPLQVAPPKVPVPAPVTQPTVTQRESVLVRTIQKLLPEFVNACEGSAEEVVLHQDAFAAEYQEDEYKLLGMAIKYAGLRGKEIRVVGRNRTTVEKPHSSSIESYPATSDGSSSHWPQRADSLFHFPVFGQILDLSTDRREPSMSTLVKRIALLFSLFVLVVFVVFLFNQTAQIVQSAKSVNVAFGNAVMWGLIFTYCLLLFTPMFLWFRLPKRILPPLVAEGAEYDRYMAAFRKRLSRNSRLSGLPLSTDAEISAGLQVLDKHADEAIKSAASAVFLSTAVLQSGRLDVLVVLAAQTRIIWNVAHVYYQRPSLRDFVQLYANVASTAFIAAGIEDIDVDTLVSTIFGSTVAAIPGMHLLTSSLLSGSANAFLTLRVGMITKEYCRCTVRVEKMGLRRAATLQAAKLLSAVVRDGTTRLYKAAASATTTNVSKAFRRLMRRDDPLEST